MRGRRCKVFPIRLLSLLKKSKFTGRSKKVKCKEVQKSKQHRVYRLHNSLLKKSKFTGRSKKVRCKEAQKSKQRRVYRHT